MLLAEQQELQVHAYEAQNQQAQQQIMFNIFNNVLRNMPRWGRRSDWQEGPATEFHRNNNVCIVI